MNMSNTRLCLILHSIPHVREARRVRFLRAYGSPEAVCSSTPRQEWSALGASAEAIRSASACLDNTGITHRIDIDAQMESLDICGAQILVLTDAAYPALLQTIYDPPPFLYVRGDVDVLQEAQLAIVGARKATPAGLRATRTLTGQLVEAGLHICSGLALGIDGEAHRAALTAGGRSIAVMATGIDSVYPARHKGLAEDLAAQGCLITEFPIGSKPERYHFPRRNRILSGLSLGVLVIEAALRSGTLITAGAALEQGREVFALPWAMFHEAGRGCLRLIRDGAKMVESVQDILDELGPLYTLQKDLFDSVAMPATSIVAGRAVVGSAENASRGQHQIFAMIGYETVGVDELVQCSAMPVAQVMAILSVLELEGQIMRCAGGYIHC